MTQSGHNVTAFTVAVNRRHRAEGKPEADYFRVTAWDKLGELAQQYLTKGKKVAVIGSVSVSTYTAQDGSVRASLDLMANEMEFLSPKEEQKEEKKPGGYVEVDGNDLPWG